MQEYILKDMETLNLGKLERDLYLDGRTFYNILRNDNHVYFNSFKRNLSDRTILIRINGDT